MINKCKLSIVYNNWQYKGKGNNYYHVFILYWCFATKIRNDLGILREKESKKKQSKDKQGLVCDQAMSFSIAHAW